MIDALVPGAAICLLVAAASSLTALEERAAEPEAVTFHGDVAPILRARCLGCHGGERPKGRLSMESLAQLLEGGRKGPALVPGKPGESLLFQLITGVAKPVMPPKSEDPLTQADIGVLRAWIVGGLRPGVRQETEVPPYSVPLEPPVYARPPAVTALAYGRGGERLYVAGYKEILVYRLAAAADDVRFPAVRLAGEAEALHALEVSPDGRLLAAVGGSPARFGEVQLWDTGTGALRRFLRLGSDSLYAAAFSTTGERLAVGGTDRSVHVIDVTTGELVYSSEIHSDWIFGVAFTGDAAGDGARLASAGRDRTVKVSGAQDGKFLKNLATIEGPVMRVVHRPGSQEFLIGAQSREAILYDAKEMKEARKLERQPGAVLAAAISADGSLAAVGGEAPEVRVYETESGKRKWSLKGHEDWVYALAFRPDGKRLAVAGYDGVVRIYDLDDGKEVRSFLSVPIGRFREF